MKYFLLVGIAVALCADHFVSFVIPCYNCEPWIAQAIESIYQQSLQCPFEIVCTDDGSTDGTWAALEALRNKHPELSLVQHPRNRGGGAARNTCVKKSRGDLLFCLDADNVLVPQSVPQLLDRMDLGGYDIVGFGMAQYFIGDFEKVGRSTYVYPGIDTFSLKDIVQNGDTPVWSGNYLYTRISYDRAGGYPEQWGALDTFTFGFHQVLQGAKMTVVPELYYWHRHGLQSYYVREALAKRLNVHFFRFLMSHEELFLPQSVKKIREQLHLALAGREFLDLQWIMGNNVLQLR